MERRKNEGWSLGVLRFWGEQFSDRTEVQASEGVITGAPLEQPRDAQIKKSGTRLFFRQLCGSSALADISPSRFLIFIAMSISSTVSIIVLISISFASSYRSELQQLMYVLFQSMWSQQQSFDPSASSIHVSPRLNALTHIHANHKKIDNARIKSK